MKQSPLQVYGSNYFILVIMCRQRTPRYSLIVSFWRGETRGEMQAMPGEILQAGVIR